jgi:hypothetical protein
VSENIVRPKLDDLAIRLSGLSLIIISAEVISKREVCLITSGVQFYYLTIDYPGFIMLS